MEKYSDYFNKLITLSFNFEFEFQTQNYIKLTLFGHNYKKEFLGTEKTTERQNKE